MGSLEGVRVLDLTRVLAGPWATQMLADLGAEVIKIERPGVGDEVRAAGPPFLKDREGRETRDSAYFLSANRGKNSVAIDLATCEGQRLVRELAAACDVMIENFMVGKLAEYGLDYETLHAVNPRLVYCSITGFGQTGPYRMRPGYDFVFQAMGGMMSITGEREGAPQKVGVAVSDLMTGMYATVAILAALRHRDRTGEGQHIDMALMDVQVAMLANMNMNYLSSGRVPGRMGNAHANLVPYQVFACRDGDIVITAGNDNLFGGLCRALEMPELARDPRFLHNPDRVRNREALIGLLQERLGALPVAEVDDRLQRHGVPCGPINNLAQVFADPQVRARGLEVKVEHPQAGSVSLVASPMRLSRTPVPHDRPPPMLAEHTSDVLGRVLGLDEDTLTRLAEARVIQCQP